MISDVIVLVAVVLAGWVCAWALWVVHRGPYWTPRMEREARHKIRPQEPEEEPEPPSPSMAWADPVVVDQEDWSTVHLARARFTLDVIMYGLAGRLRLKGSAPVPTGVITEYSEGIVPRDAAIVRAARRALSGERASRHHDHAGAVRPPLVSD